MVYSSSSIQASIKHDDGGYYLKKQILFVMIGLLVMVFIARTRYLSLQTLSWPLLAVSAVPAGEETAPASKLRGVPRRGRRSTAPPYHYRVVDIKFSTLYLIPSLRQ